MTDAAESLLHDGEIEARRRFGAEGTWPDAALRRMIRPVLDRHFAAFIEAQPFFFIATANAAGACDCSFRGTEDGADGRPLPAVKVLDEQHLVFPDYAGNKLYNSLGNIIENPQIGMLFMDFRHRLRARVNGRAEIVETAADAAAFAGLWPRAQRHVVVTVDQAFGNCQARIPQLVEPGAGTGD